MTGQQTHTSLGLTSVSGGSASAASTGANGMSGSIRINNGSIIASSNGKG